MRTLILSVLALCLSSPAALADTVVHPDETRVATFDVQTVALGPSPLETCLVLEGADKDLTVSHFECFGVVTDQITTHPVTVPEGGGHVRVFAITRYTDPDGLLVVSALSDNRGKALDVPTQPTLLARVLSWLGLA